MSVEFLDKVVLLSSAVADADNHVMMHGRKLELLVSMEEFLPKVPKPEIVSAQKKVEDLCLRILFQNCPYILIRPIVSVLSLLYSRGSAAAMHACVAFLFQLAGHSADDSSSKLDRPIPGCSDQDEGSDRKISVHEKSVCLSVAVGIVVAKGPSASYFVPNAVAVVQKHLKLHDPAARESAIRSIASVIEVLGVPGSALGGEIFKNILYKGVYVDKSPQVKLASAYALAAFCKKCTATVTLHAETIWALCLRILASGDNQTHSGGLLVEIRNAHVDLLVQLLFCLISTTAAADTSTSVAISSSIKTVSSFSTAVSLLIGFAAKKYRALPFALEALTTCAIRLFIECGEREEDAFLLSHTVLTEVSVMSVSVATRMLARLLRAGAGDSGVLRIVSEVLMPVLRVPVPGTALLAPSEQASCVALSGLVEAMSIVESSISALDSDLSSDLIQLLTTSSSVSIATNAAYALRALCRVNPVHAFPLVNVLLNHLTIQHAELAGTTKSGGFLQVKKIMHCSLALASVLCESKNQLPLDVTGAVISTAAALIDVGEEDMASLVSDETIELIMWRRKYSGFLLLIPIVSGGGSLVSSKIVTLLTLWKNVLGKKTRENLSKQIAPGSVISDIQAVIEPLQTVLLAARSLREFLIASADSIDSDSIKLIVIFLNNLWQLVQAAVPLELSTEDSDVTITTVLHGIRSEIYHSFSLLDPAVHLESIAKPLIVFLTSEVLKEDNKLDPSLLFSRATAPFQQQKQESSDSLWFNSCICDSADFDACKPEFLLSNSVLQAVGILQTGASVVPVKDFYASSISSGSLEHYFSIFNRSFGSPFCPLVPFVQNLNSLSPLAAQMVHPVFESKLFSIKLLSKLLIFTDKASFDACANVLVSSLTSAMSPETQTDADIAQGAKLAVVAVAATVVFVFRNTVEKTRNNPSDLGSGNFLSLFASPIGLGANHPFIRRVSAMAIAAIITVQSSLHDSVFQLITDASVSSNGRVRSATALLIGFLIQFDPSSVSIFAPNLFRLARELVLPIRTCSLFAIFSACSATQSAIAPWGREVAKIATAHAVADLYPSISTAVLISAILCAFLPVANLVRQSEGKRSYLVWHEFKETGQFGYQDLSLAKITERFCIVFASRANFSGEDERIEYVINQIGSSGNNCSGNCRSAIVGLTELTEQGVGLVGSVSALFDSLLVMLETNRSLRREANKLLKAVVRIHGNSCLSFILSALGTRPDRNENGNEPEEDNDYGSDNEEGDGNMDRKKAMVEQGIKRRKLSLTSKAMMLKCLKRIFKDGKMKYRRNSFTGLLDQIVNVCVSAVAGGDSSAELAIQGAKLLCIVINLFMEDFSEEKKCHEKKNYLDENIKEEIDQIARVPVLLQYETQIMSALRRGVRTNSDSPSLVQKLCIKALEMIVSKNLTCSVDKCIELLVQPLVLVDPSTMPWSSFFAIREAGNSIMSGRSPLVQTSEKETSLILFSRIEAIVNLYKHVGAGFEKHAIFIEYFLQRLLIDCAIAMAHKPPQKYAQNLFSYLQSDLDALFPFIKQTLIPVVLNGICANPSFLQVPADCPFKDSIDMKALYIGVCIWFALEAKSSTHLDQLAKPACLVPEILEVFKLRFDADSELPLFNLLNMAKSVKNDEIAWNLTRLGIGNSSAAAILEEDHVKEIGETIVRLSSVSFFQEVSRAQELLRNVLLQLVQKHPHLVVKILRESLNTTHDLLSLLVLMDGIDSLFVQVRNELKNYVILLLIPVFTRLVAVAGDNSEEDRLIACLERMKRNLLACAITNSSTVIQCLRKLLTVECPSVVFSNLLIPSVVEIACINLKDSQHLIPLLVSLIPKDLRDRPFWKSLLLFVLKVSSFDACDKEIFGNCIVSCMQPLSVFKDTLSQLSIQEKVKVESLVRKYLPKSRATDNESDDGKSIGTAPQESVSINPAAAPQIQLKLKFTAPPKI